jgi:hypothetical protein
VEPFHVQKVDNVFDTGRISAIILRRHNDNAIRFLNTFRKIKGIGRRTCLVFQALSKNGKLIDVQVEDLCGREILLCEIVLKIPRNPVAIPSCTYTRRYNGNMWHHGIHRVNMRQYLLNIKEFLPFMDHVGL